MHEPPDYNGPTGTVRLHVEIEVPVEAIVSHWTREEAANLAAEDPEAQDELVTQAFGRRDRWSSFSVEDWTVKLDG